VREAKERLDGLPDGDSEKVRGYERSHEDRKTPVGWLDGRIGS
jgi:hypothetical protein